MCKTYYESEAVVVQFKEETENICSVWLQSEEITKIAKPGQFANIQVSDSKTPNPVLRRPFAISSVEGDKFEMIFDVVGRGTEILRKTLIPGAKFNISGPLGNGFLNLDSGRKKLLIAGGLGIAPIKYLMNHFIKVGADTTLIWGNRDKSNFFDLNSYLDSNVKFFITSDNGSIGFSGNVLDLIERSAEGLEDLSNYDIYVVGPTPMMRAVSEYLTKKGIDSQVSLEEPMACGIGVCQGCAVERKDGDGFYLVCKDGPVFYASTINF
jgi:dihydroorotate dehydrogenase electron transfer subunit